MKHLYHRYVVLLFEVINDPAEDNIYIIEEVGTALTSAPSRLPIKA